MRIKIMCELELSEDGDVHLVHRDSPTLDGSRHYGIPAKVNAPDAWAVLNGLGPWILDRFRAEVDNLVAIHMERARDSKKGGK